MKKKKRNCHPRSSLSLPGFFVIILNFCFCFFFAVSLLCCVAVNGCVGVLIITAAKSWEEISL